MSKSHKKKRNVGLLYEFLVQTISRSLIDGNKKRSTAALKILKKHFKPGTELYREFRLMNSIMKTTVSSESVASSIMQEAKRACRSYNLQELDRQKSLLIRDINHMINDENFYDQPVENYRNLATIQTLFNDWRSSDVDLSRLAQYEDQVVKLLITEKSSMPEKTLTEESPGTNRLLMKVMMKKLNEKYSNVLNDDQKSLIKAYAFSTAADDNTSIKLKLTEIKEKLVESIDAYATKAGQNDFTNKKLQEAKQQLLSENLDAVDDDTVTRFMLYTKLTQELDSEEQEDV